MIELSHGFIDSLAGLDSDGAKRIFALVTLIWLLLLLGYEFLNGKLAGNKRTFEDWQISGLSFFMASVVQRPFVFGVCFFIMALFMPFGAGEWREFNQEYFWICLVGFLAIDELLHGGTHFFSHAKTPSNKYLANFQKFLKRAHRPHHLHGGTDGKGEMSVAHSPVEHWAFLFLLPNYWFSAIVLYLGFVEVFLIGTIIKTMWVFHVHTNWNYDLYFLNHKNPFVRKTMFALCHVFTFPTQHHQHHSRSKNSGKNMQNFLAVYDWLFWKTLVVETERPLIYGWRQSPEESSSVFYRFFANNLN